MTWWEYSIIPIALIMAVMLLRLAEIVFKIKIG